MGKRSGLIRVVRIEMVPPTRLERVAYGLGNRRSIHLSYGGTEAGPIMLCEVEVVKLQHCVSYFVACMVLHHCYRGIFSRFVSDEW